MRIPYDALVLEAVVEELQPYVGGRVQGIRQPDDLTLGLALYAGGGEATFLLCCHPEFARAHFVARRLANQPHPPTFCATLRARIDGGTLRAARQVAGDRILELSFESAAGSHVLIAELMGKHSNLMLVEEAGRIVAAAKWVAESKSVRPILSGRPYLRPPTFDGQPHRSPFLQKLLDAGGSEDRPFHPVLSPGNGAYPVSVAQLDLKEFPRSSLSLALEAHFDQSIVESEITALRGTLVGQLKRAILARETALGDLRQALDQGQRAGRLQREAELILAYGSGIPEGSSVLTAWDYDGAELAIRLDPTLDYKENANRLFEKAKKSKGRLQMVQDQIGRMESDAARIASLLGRIEAEDRLDRLRELKLEAEEGRWLNQQRVHAGPGKDDRPFEGHRVRELLGPGGYRVLFGETSEANDYLTLRVAKPNDWWLHVRGNRSAHVVVPTQNQPERVGMEVLLFAAKVAVQNSPTKHSGYVPVDYTLRKYVRRPRGAALGTVLYTHEKTLHVD